MIYRIIHNRWLRILLAIFGTLISSFAINTFIVPMGLYTGGLLGFCQVARTLLVTKLGLDTGTLDIAGVFYFCANLPLLFLAWRTLGRGLAARTIVCTLASSFFLSVIPAPSSPVVYDMLTCALLGGILVGLGSGIVLTCGCSSGGLDIVGLYLSKKGTGLTVGKFSLGINAVLYSICLLLFEPAVAIYSLIYNTFCSVLLDRMHQQNITVQAMIFTHDEHPELPKFIMENLGRGVTYWEGKGAYTDTSIRVLCVCLSKYEIDELRHVVQQMDPTAFFIIQEGVSVVGNFKKKIG
ncbi:MAG: YitT family protein [Oscillospiraceae bacterium]